MEAHPRQLNVHQPLDSLPPMRSVVVDSHQGIQSTIPTSSFLHSGPRMGLFVGEEAATQSSSMILYDTPRRAKVTATSNIKANAAKSSSPSTSSSVKSITTTTKKPARDSSRRANHSQIERRRREKINDRLVTLRSLVPACAAEIEEKKRQRRQEEEEARQIAAGEKVASRIPGKRKRIRKRANKAQQGVEKEDELGLHKLEVLTHAIDYIYELQDVIRGLRGENDDTTPRRVLRNQVETDQEQDNEDEEEDCSEADLEMSEWKPSIKRSFNTLRSNSSSTLSSSTTSPAIMSLSAESPMFSTTNSSSGSNSVFTNLTSPMMSLSSESPILRWNNQTSFSSPSSSKEKEQSSIFQHGNSWQLPAPALPLSSDGNGKNAFVKKKANAGEVANRNDTSKEAQLLLNFSSSPEVLRPISALRQTFQTGQRRKSTTMPIGSGANFSNKLARIGGSAPGGAHPSNPVSLVSPPLLDLDATPLSSVTKTK